MNKILLCKNYTGFDFALKVSDGEVDINILHLSGPSREIKEKNSHDGKFQKNNCYYVTYRCGIFRDIFDNLAGVETTITHEVDEDESNIETLDYSNDKDREIIQNLKVDDINSVIKSSKTLYIELRDTYE